VSLHLPQIRERLDFSYAYLRGHPALTGADKRLPPDLVQLLARDVPELFAEIRRLHAALDNAREACRQGHRDHSEDTVTTPAHLVDRPANDNPLTRAWLPWALGRVDNIAALDGSIAPATDAAATAARSLLNTISALYTVRPEIAPQPLPDGDGGIHIAWREHGFELDLYIEPNGQIGGWLRRNADKAEVGWGEEPDGQDARTAGATDGE